MTPEDYNKRTMRDLGWSRWHLALPAEASMDEITEAVKKFQADHKLVVDGKVGPATYRRFLAEQEFRQDIGKGLGFIIVGGNHVSVPFQARACSTTSAMSLVGKGGHGERSGKPTQVLWHWDACLSAKSCHKVLAARNLSSHGVIDNDGTFYQFLDFEDHYGWHAGHRRVNRASIGIDVSNAVYLKYQSYYTKRYGPRPEITASVHGRRHELLGYYPAQVATARQLALFVEDQFGIPRTAPSSTTVIDKPEFFNGHLAHYHVKSTKWDVAGFPFDTVLGD